MGTQLIAGQNAKLNDAQLTFSLAVGNDQGASLDASAILLANTGKVSSDDDFIFFNQPKHPSGGVEQKDGSTFSVDLSKVPGHLERIAFVLTVEPGLSALSSGYRFDLKGNADQFEFSGQGTGRQEKSLIVCELYRRNGEWKVKVVDQGFAGGMAPLAEHFGVDVDSNSKPAPTPTPAPAPPKPQEKLSINLSKITLDKKGDTISLEKKSATFGKIHVNLNWDQTAGAGASKKGLFGSLLGGKQGGVDLDLGCMFEFKDGTKGIVQALGNNFGSLERAPYIFLDGDDRTGSVNQGENLYLNGQHWGDIKRVMIFAFIYEGVANWAQTNGRVSIKAPDQPEIEIRMDASGKNENFCVIAMLENQNGALNISKEVNYFGSHKPADNHYGFGFQWKASTK
ncbi:tellurium resistance protein TerA [Halovibrio variabilis]|uniref:Tellurium resistance protein TerA n=1 Tax=Halovibrio variabilis TaxID=31910 RepID=A0A511USN2_9GAMM|nr:TerD family protein [Halovibrio variabilis]GEN28192.1 tellurium resistance protein TerA [Halovibrio variabilis]